MYVLIKAGFSAEFAAAASKVLSADFGTHGGFCCFALRWGLGWLLGIRSAFSFAV